MKLSKYIINTPKDKKSYFFYNTLNGKKLIINQSLECIELLIKTNQLHKIIDYQLLKQFKFLLDNNENEEDVIQQMFDSDYFGDEALSLTILPTSACNAKCVYCYEDMKPLNMEDDVLQSIVNYVGKELDKYHVLNIGWFGGEPLVALPIIKKLSRAFGALCILHQKSYIAGMTTNATLLSYDVFTILNNLNVKNYQITLDGLEETHNKLKPLKNGANGFKMVIDNLRNIRDNYDKDDISIVIRTNITKTIDKDMENFLNFLSDEFKGDKRFKICFKLASDWGGNTVHNINNELIKSSDYLDYIKSAHYKGLSIQHYIDSFKPCGNICYAARKNHMVFDYLGNIYKCTVAFNNENNLIGKIAPDGVLDMDDNKLSKWIDIPKDEIKKCLDCKVRPICLGHCCPNSIIEKGFVSCPPELLRIKDFLEVI